MDGLCCLLAVLAVACICSRSLLQYCAVHKLQQLLQAAANGLIIFTVLVCYDIDMN
jgi:hypothetical protein